MHTFLFTICLLSITAFPALASGEGGCSFSKTHKGMSQEANIMQAESSDISKRNVYKMKDSLFIRIVASFSCLLFLVSPTALYADEIDSSIRKIEPGERVEAPKEMSQKQMNDLLGEDPYLGQTSYLQSPDGFTQRDKSK